MNFFLKFLNFIMEWIYLYMITILDQGFTQSFKSFHWSSCSDDPRKFCVILSQNCLSQSDFLGLILSKFPAKACFMIGVQSTPLSSFVNSTELFCKIRSQNSWQLMQQE